jgi:hypothetical protein
MPDKDQKEKEKNNADNLDVEKARQVVLETIGEGEKETNESAGIDGDTLEEMKKAKESAASIKEFVPSLTEEVVFEDMEDEKIEKIEKEIVMPPIAEEKKEDEKDKIIKEIKEEKDDKKEKEKIKIFERMEEKRTEKKIIKKEKHKIPRKYFKKWHKKKISFSVNLSPRARLIIKILTITFSSSLILFIIFYLSLIFFVVRRDADNKMTRFMAGRLPVPVFITNAGIVPYYQYKDILKMGNVPPEKVKLFLLKKLVINNKTLKAGELKVWSLIR